jgi:hypothetical protein
MKKTTLIIAILALSIFGTSVFAQSSATATVDATVVAALSVAKDADVDFGQLLVGATTPTIDPTGASHSGLLGTPTVGEFTITGSSGAQVNVTLTSASTNLGDGTNTLLFTADLKEGNTQGSASTISNPITMAAGTHKLWLGGSLPTLTGTTPGTYTSDNGTNGGGDIEVNVVYN